MIGVVKSYHTRAVHLSSKREKSRKCPTFLLAREGEGEGEGERERERERERGEGGGKGRGGARERGE